MTDTKTYLTRMVLFLVVIGAGAAFIANTLAGIEGGARQVEVAINGIGERAGNAALEEVAAALLVRRDVLPYTSNIVNTELYPTSALLSEIVNHKVSPNKAVVGKNAFAHESGAQRRRLTQQVET